MKRIGIIFTSLSLLVTSFFVFGKNNEIKPAFASNNEELLVYEDFEDPATVGFDGNIDVVDGKGVYNNTSDYFNGPFAQTASNNYEVSFDIRYTSAAGLYFHFVNLDGNGDNRNIFFEVLGGGSFYRFSDFNNNDIYDNSGQDQGSIPQDFKERLSSTGVNFKFVVLDKTLEFFADGRRYITVPFAAFGNNRYPHNGENGRIKIQKGTMTGFGFDVRGPKDSLVLDNFKIKEAKYKEAYYSSNEVITASDDFLPITCDQLYKPNFLVKARFKMQDELCNNPSIAEFPKIGLLMNQQTGLMRSGDTPSNIINCQMGVNGWEAYDIGIFGVKSDFYYSPCWLPDRINGLEGNFILDFFVEVFGDYIRLTVTTNGTVAPNSISLTGSFSQLGLVRGDLLAIKIENRYSTCLYSEYRGFDEEGVIVTSVDKEKVRAGETVVASRQLFGTLSNLNDGYWYVDNSKTSEMGETLTTSFTTVGEHTIQFGNSQHKSEILKVVVSDVILTISCNNLNPNNGDTVTFTLTISGSIGEQINWFVNDELQSSHETTLQFEVLTGVCKVQAKVATFASNIIELVVAEPVLTLQANKYTANYTENINLTLTGKGIASLDDASWFVNGNEANLVGVNPTLSLSSYKTSGEIEIYAKVGQIKSNPIYIKINYDLLSDVTNLENYRTVYEFPVTYSSNPTFGLSYDLYQRGDDYYYRPNAPFNETVFDPFFDPAEAWVMEYDLLVPSYVSYTFFVYPQIKGLDALNPNDFVEACLQISNSHIEPYFKFHDRNITYGFHDYKTGADVYNGNGNVTYGEFNHITVACQNSCLGVYLNSALVYFAKIPNLGSPESVKMSMFFGQEQSWTDMGFRNFKYSAVGPDAPGVESVSISASMIQTKVGETITLSANITPFGAVAETIEWYCNGQKIECNELTYLFTPEAEGTYEFVCKVNGVSSAPKTINVVNDNETPDNPAPTTGNDNDLILILSLSIGGGVLAIAGVVLFFVLRKRKFKKAK